VSWPGKNEVVGTTAVVIVACFLFGFYLFLVDAGLSWVIDKLYVATGVVAS
jgi:preprotein translocase SecE subunit